MHRLKYSSDYPFKPFLFIGERLNPKYKKGKPFFKDYFLKQADKEQVEAIKRIAKTDELLNLKSRNGSINIYENDLIIKREKGGVSTTPVPLKPSDYKYWIIELSEFLFDYNLFPAISLMSKNLTVIAQIGKMGAYTFDHLKAAVFYSDYELLAKEEIEINESDLEEIEFIYNSLNAFKASSFNKSLIEKSLNDFLRIGGIEYKSPFKIIALFSVIESLLTTNNKNSDQSINRQLQKKIKLINNQLEVKIDFFQYFKGPDTLTEEKIIEILYTYRSKIAHGDYYDFEKELQVLEGHEMTFDFLNLLTKKLLLFAINNCQLTLDIKEC